jgi:hypothetical protein
MDDKIDAPPWGGLRVEVLGVLAHGRPMRSVELLAGLLGVLNAATPSLHWDHSSVAVALRSEVAVLVLAGVVAVERDYSEDAAPSSVVIRLVGRGGA